MKQLKKFATILILILVFGLATPQSIPPLSFATTAEAATIKISKKNITLKVGQSTTLKISGTKKKVSWKSSDKKIATVTSKGKVTAKKKGTAKITAKIGKKSLVCKITVTEKKSNKGDGARENPFSAYQKHTVNIYYFEEYIGKFKIQLLDYKSGKEAYDYVMQNEYNSKPTSSQEYIYVKFKIDYISGKKQVNATDVINHYSDFFNSKSNYQLDNIGWGYGFEDVDDMVDVSLYPGGSAICSKAIIVKKGNSPITYRIQTGYDTKNYEREFTWFTTKQ